MAAREFLIGCNGRGCQQSSIEHPVSLVEPSIEEQFRMVKESGAFDYFDRLPQPEQMAEYQRCIVKYGLPVHTCSWFYMLGKEEPLIERNLRLCAEVGAKCHNVMTFTRHADGHVLTDQEIADSYSWIWERGAMLGVEPSFELHVNMWTEDPRRVEPVARLVRARGLPFNFTLDYSHINFKIENPEEQDISGIREDVAAGRVVLDPFQAGNLGDLWLDMGIVRWVQLRAVAPNGPKNLWAKNDQGEYGRGIQYPFIQPKPGEFHSPWYAYKLEPSKQAIRNALRYHLTHPDSPLRYMTTEMINLVDYGLGAKYSLFEQNVACARWIRATWAQMKSMHAAGIPLTV
ncbi:MAG: sugar phosphate isomerase/epimerase family protein [Alphaproteobacteria bacterium]